MQTARGIFENLEESNIFLLSHEIIFVFSSEFNKKRFIKAEDSYLSSLYVKLRKLFNNVNKIDLDKILLIKLYKKIEKRGYLVYDIRHKFIDESSFEINCKGVDKK